jgi:anti-anti-sigma regulatory factor
MQNISFKNSSAGNTVKTLIEGELLITEAEELKEALLGLLNNYQSIHIEFRNITRLDVSVLQLLKALANSAEEKGRSLDYHFEESEYVSGIMKLSGYEKAFDQHITVLS